MNNDYVQSKVVVITGASAGVGRAAAKRFAGDHHKIALIARGKQGLEAAKDEVESLGGTAMTIQCDVSDFDQLNQAASKVEEKFGPIDIWINNAMTTVFAPFMEITPKDFKRVTEVTYLGQVNGTMAALKRMKPRDRGTIVQVGSALAYRGIPLQSAYCGAKHAIQGFTESLRSELLHEGSSVHISMVQMPALNTPQFDWCKTTFDKKPRPVPPIYQPEVAADAIHYAAFNNKREMYVGMSTAVIVNGNKFFPGYGDKYLAKNGFNSQLSNQSIDKNRPNNLYEPVEGDFGTHGDFDNISKDRSWQLKIDKNKNLINAAAAGLAAVTILGALFKKLL
ncbi:MAG TPA: SDR family oxidoreductase [Ignavibacteriaceae bacterium]|jgi:short-subunit dehydrogenase|nr:SDR family oxidoreductase [Ignavibacteriaceae bacterium]